MFKRVLWIFILSMLTTIGWAKGDILPDTTANDSSQIVLIGGRYVFMQSGFPVEKRTLQYQNLNALVNDIQYGITDEITLAGGLFLPFYAYIAPQYSVEVAKNQRMVVGDILTSSLFLEDDFLLRANLIYGGYTIGNIHNHATLAMGYLSTNRLPEGSLVFQFGGCKRLSERIFLLGEVWYSSGRQNMPQVNQWVYGSNGQRQLVDESNPDRLTDTEKISLSPHFGPYSTFNGFQAQEQEGRHIDYIFTKNPGKFKVLKHATLTNTWGGRFASDHHAVMVVLGW
jgi:hypothetical protein